MKKLVLIASAILCLITSNAFAFDNWSKTDIALQSIYTALHVIDWGQTIHESKHNWNTIQESNFILGKTPSQSSVNIYFASTLADHTLITHILPSDWRKYWQGLGIGIETFAVVNNYSIRMNGFF